MAVLVGLLWGLVGLQAWWTWRYWPQSVRAQVSYQDKVGIGNASWTGLFWALACPTRASWADGVAWVEGACSPGLCALLVAFLSPPSVWHGVLLGSLLLALGKRTPLFRWTHWLHWRLPVRYTVFLGASLGMLAIQGFQRLPLAWQPIVLLLQAWQLLTHHSRLLPPWPFCQRWENPARVLETPLTQYLQQHPGRVVGLPYPLRTGQWQSLQTLGYLGASARQVDVATWADRDPWQDPTVRYAYTWRPLRLCRWHLTPIPHLYEHLHAHD